MSHTISDLREHLFATLRDLRNKENPMEIDRAKAVSDVAQTIINSAKVEVEHLRLTGKAGSGFIPEQPADPTRPQLTANGTKTVTAVPGGTVTRHRLV